MLINFYLFIRAIIFDETCVLEMTMYMHKYLFNITVKLSNISLAKQKFHCKNHLSLWVLDKNDSVI